MTERRPQPPSAGAVLRAPVAAPTSTDAPVSAPSTPAEPAPATPAAAPAGNRSASQVLQGRRSSAQTARAAATGEAEAVGSPIARRRAAARKQAQEKAAAAAAASTVKPTAAPVERRRVVEPPVDIRQRRLGQIHPGQLIAAEVAVVGGLVAAASPLPVMIPVAIVALLTLLVCFVRIDGRWLYEWIGIWLRFRTRSRTATLKQPTPGSGVAAAVSHGGDLKRMEVDGAPVAVLSDSTGFTAILEVVLDAGDSVGAGRDLPSLAELLPHNEPGDVPISVQVMTHLVPAPNIAAMDDAAANSYRELSGGAVPARRRTWVCVQAMHSPDVTSAITMEKALVNAVKRVERRLRKLGFRPRLRGVRETAADLLMLIRVDPSTLGSGPTLQESWSTWTAGQAQHVTYRVSEWPALAQRRTAGALIDGLEGLPVTALTTSLSGRRTGEYVDVEWVMRFTVDNAAAVRSVDNRLTETLRGTGADLRRLDGSHRFGVGATLPMGGFAA